MKKMKIISFLQMLIVSISMFSGSAMAALDAGGNGFELLTGTIVPGSVIQGVRYNVIVQMQLTDGGTRTVSCSPDGTGNARDMAAYCILAEESQQTVTFSVATVAGWLSQVLGVYDDSFIPLTTSQSY